MLKQFYCKRFFSSFFIFLFFLCFVFFFTKVTISITVCLCYVCGWINLIHEWKQDKRAAFVLWKNWTISLAAKLRQTHNKLWIQWNWKIISLNNLVCGSYVENLEKGILVNLLDSSKIEGNSQKEKNLQKNKWISGCSLFIRSHVRFFVSSEFICHNWRTIHGITWVDNVKQFWQSK